MTDLELVELAVLRARDRYGHHPPPNEAIYTTLDLLAKELYMLIKERKQ